jgi:hypothetical protein
MAVSLKHTTQAVGTDAGNGEIRKAQWNEEHTLSLATGKLLGRTTAATGAAEEITPSTGLTLSAGNLTVNAALAISGGTVNNSIIGGTTAAAGAFTTLAASSTVSGTGFSTYLASPPAIGGTAAAAGSFTTLAASSTVSGTGFSTYLASPPAIGGTAAAAGSFTTLAASSTVSGTGFSTYLASPPAIGGTAAAAGSFTTLAASSTVSGTGFSTYLASPPAIGGTVAAAVTGAPVASTSVVTSGFTTLAAGTLALAFASKGVVQVTPNATGSFTTTVPPAGTRCTLIVLTSGATSFTMTFGTGFKTTGTLATGTVTARYFNFQFISDGTNLIECSRTVAIA